MIIIRNTSPKLKKNYIFDKINIMIGSGSMKKLLSIFIIFFISITSVKALNLPVEITGESAIVYNLDSNQIIYEKNPDTVYTIASLTKIMNAYTAINNVKDLNKKVTITDKDVYNLWGYTIAGLEVGAVVTYKDLLYAMILPSGADASQALAYHISGSPEEYIKLMNKEAKKLGLRNANFMDTYGGHDDNKATAREILRLTLESLKNKDFEQVFKTTQTRLTNGKEVVNYTRSIATYHGYDSELITGSKSGFTIAAGLNLVSTTTINNTNYLIVVLKCNLNAYNTQHVIDTYNIIHHLQEQKFETRTIIKKGTKIKSIPVEESTISEYIVYAEDDIKVTLPIEEFSNIKIETNITDKISNKIKTGDNLGYIDIKLNNEVLSTTNIYLKDNIYKIAKIPRNIIITILVLLLLIFIIFINNLFGKKKTKKK